MTTTGSTTTFTTTSPAAAPGRRLLQQLGTDTRYLLLGFPLAVASFVTLVTGFALGVGLLAITLGLPVLAATLYAARGFADVERLQLRTVTGRQSTRPAYRRSGPTRNPYRRAFTQLTHGQGWLDLLHGVATFALSIFTFVLTVTWWAMAAGGVSYWFWERFLPEGGNDIVVTAVLGSYSHAGEIALFTGAGLLALVTLPFVVRGLAAMRAGFARTLLADLDAYRNELGQRETTR